MKREHEYRKFIDGDMFVPINIRDSYLQVKTGKKIDLAVTATMVLVGVAILVFFTTIKGFRDITGFNLISSISIYLIVFTILVYFISAKFIFRIDEHMKRRALSGSETFDVNLGSIWRIRAGGIKVNNTTSGNMMVISYDGKPAFIFKRTNGSIEGKHEDADKIHYKGIQSINDILLKEAQAISKLNLKHNTTTDKIWDYESKRLYQAESIHGETYARVMQDIINHRYDYTTKYSRICSKYYIVICKPNTSVTEMVNTYESIERYSGNTQSVTSLVDVEEFQTLLTQYYGLNNIDINNMIPINSGTETIGNSKVLDFVRKDGTIDVNKLPVLEIPDTRDYEDLYPKGFASVGLDPKDNMEKPEINISIFSQEYM